MRKNMKKINSKGMMQGRLRSRLFITGLARWHLKSQVGNTGFYVQQVCLSIKSAWPCIDGIPGIRLNSLGILGVDIKEINEAAIRYREGLVGVRVFAFLHLGAGNDCPLDGRRWTLASRQKRIVDVLMMPFSGYHKGYSRKLPDDADCHSRGNWSRSFVSQWFSLLASLFGSTGWTTTMGTWAAISLRPCLRFLWCCIMYWKKRKIRSTAWLLRQ